MSPHAAPTGSPARVRARKESARAWARSQTLPGPGPCSPPPPARGEQSHGPRQRSVLPALRCPRMCSAPGCAVALPAAPGCGDALLWPGRREGRPSRSQPAVIRQYPQTPGERVGWHPPLGSAGLEAFGPSAVSWVQEIRDRTGLWAVFCVSEGGESPLHPAEQSGRGPSGGLKLCESAGKHLNRPNF